MKWAANIGLAALLAVAGLSESVWPAEPRSRPDGAGVGDDASRILEVAGVVEVRLGTRTDWEAAVPGMALRYGDRMRTGAESRAALRLSDRSILRLNERTILEIQPPRAAEKRRFGLLQGILFFFNRERPADIEFETPIAAGAIRGTEFVLASEGGDGPTRLAMLDGRVEMLAANHAVTLDKGEQVRIEPGSTPIKSRLVDAAGVVQWALYYPAVVVPEDLRMAEAETAAFAESLSAYRAGDCLAAQEAAARVPAAGEAANLFRAALDLAVGRVDRAESRLAEAPATAPVALALRELIAVVRGEPGEPGAVEASPTTASEWLARSFRRQSRHQLREALEAAERAAILAPESGYAHARVAELRMAFDRYGEALEAAERAIILAPRLAPAWSLRGFAHLQRDDPRRALAAFEQALAVDAALGSAWLGRGLAEMRLRRRTEALRSLQTAAALDPRRALHRAYLGKAFSDRGEAGLAEKEFHLARELDGADPTPWFYAALHEWMENRPNLAVRSLERSVELNDHRQLFRSRLGLDRDLAVRQANLAALYQDAGLPEVGRRAASRAVAEDYANFSSHLFLANSYRALEDPGRFDLRFEAARQSEFLVANLLAPPGGANLSPAMSQPERLAFFDQRPLGLSTLTEYQSSGQWRQEASAFGTADGLSYAVDEVFSRIDGTAGNDDGRRGDVMVQLKQRVTAADEWYFQAAFAEARAGDIARHEDPASAKPGFRVEEAQIPNLYLGWHHAWSAATHSLLLFSRLTDHLELDDPRHDVLFLRQAGGTTISASTPPFFEFDYESRFTLYSAEFQQVWSGETHSLISGVRGQAGVVEAEAGLSRPLTGRVTDQAFEEPLGRVAIYLYDHWRLGDRLHLVAGVSYDWLKHPVNSDVAPLTEGTATADQISPKAGFLWTPWRGSLWRAGYTRSLGGQYFDPSVRLEPAQMAGFPQVFRSLLPESVGGLVPGTAFDALNAGFDQQVGKHLYLGVEAGWLRSDSGRVVGTLTNSLPLPIPDSPSSTWEELEYEESSLAAYAVVTLGEGFSVGVRYRIAEARFDAAFPEIPDSAMGLRGLEQDVRSVLQESGATVNYVHASGLFGRWESLWFQQDNDGYAPESPGDDLWQHNAWVGYRWPRRRAELRLGVMNLTDSDYRLNPMNAYPRLPRERTAVISLRLNF